METASHKRVANTCMTDDLIFSLDIGTRSVVGVVGTFRGKEYEVLEFEQRFHESRAMNDGQIESIELVASVCAEVKAALEERMGIRLEKVAIAAAGRALKTQTASFERTISRDEEITAELVRDMEYIAIGDAYEAFSEQSNRYTQKEGTAVFYPVGYSVLGYYLDNEPFSDLVGHRGEKVKVNVIAAFLPEKVVQSLYAVTKQLHLQVVSLTLEPIAAINIIVPKDIRILNIAMVDIGAGTSDIAISKNGSIVAYDMVTMAGDEITEAIMKKNLTNFKTAERIKLSLNDLSSEIEFTDILGNIHKIKADEIFKSISETIDTLAEVVSEHIVKCNGGVPVAIFLTGGGSLIPQLCTRIAGILELQEERVKVAGGNVLDNIKLCSPKLKSPEFITPIGIGMVMQSYNIKDFLSVTVNGSKVMLKHISKNTVADALLLAGIKIRSMIGTSAPMLNFTLNGETKIIKGTAPIQGELRVNGNISALDTPIKQGDVITALPAENGKAVTMTLEQMLKVNGFDAQCCTVKVNSKECKNDYMICKGDIVEIEEYRNENDVSDVDTKNKSKEKGIALSLNGKTVRLKSENDQPSLFVDLLNFVNVDTKNMTGSAVLKLNGEDATFMTALSQGDVAEISFQLNNEDANGKGV